MESTAVHYHPILLTKFVAFMGMGILLTGCLETDQYGKVQIKWINQTAWECLARCMTKGIKLDR